MKLTATPKEKYFLTRTPLLLTLLIGGLLVLGAAREVSAQRTVEVEPGFGTLNDAIHGDTTATGARVDSNTVYVLQGGLTFEDRYYLNGSILSGNYHLQVATEESATEPPILQVLSDETGASAGTFFEAEGDVTIRGLYLLGMDDLDAPRSQAIIMNGDDKHLVVDNVYIDYNRFIVFRFNGLNGNLRLTNSHIRNVLTTNNPGNGKVIDGRGNNLESVYVENNTFEGVSAEFTRLSGAVFKSLFFNHNTVYTMHGFVRDDFRENSNKLVEAKITNNLFINMGWVGDTLATADPPSNHHVGIFSFDSLSVVPELSEEDRDVRISNNNFFWEQELADFFESGFTTTCDLCTGGTVGQYPIFNPRAQLFVDAGLVSYDDNIEEDPEFGQTSGISNFIEWTKGYWTDPPSVSATMIYYDPDGAQEVTTWPLPEDFSYPITKMSYTAGTGGFPLGDLNWFSDKKAEWEAAGGGTGVIVANEDEAEVPDDFTLRGNYPNPFNPSTRIEYDLNVPAEVSVVVFDLLGRQVLAVPVRQVSAGVRQQIHVDASSLASGIYLYQVTARAATQTFIETGRMALIK